MCRFPFVGCSGSQPEKANPLTQDNNDKCKELDMLLWFEAVFRIPRQYKRLLQLTADAGLIVLSFIVAMLLRLDSWQFMDSPTTWLPLLAVIPVSLLLFVRLGFYRAIIRYMTHKAVEALLVGVAASTLCLV